MRKILEFDYAIGAKGERISVMRREARDLVIGQNVAGGVGRAGNADRGDLISDLQCIEIDVVLEIVVTDQFDPRLNRCEDLAPQGLIRVTDVFGNERQQDLLVASVGVMPGQGVEQEKESRLTSDRDRHILRSDVPAELAAEQGGD